MRGLLLDASGCQAVKPDIRLQPNTNATAGHHLCLAGNAFCTIVSFERRYAKRNVTESNKFTNEYGHTTGMGGKLIEFRINGAREDLEDAANTGKISPLTSQL
eukprot:scaffold206200_cov33-Prasinocladus_malaysianus.AAC.1